MEDEMTATAATGEKFDTRTFDGKPIEFSQQKRIISLAGYLQLDVDKLARETYGRQVHELNRLEGTMMVQDLDRRAVAKVESQRDRHHHNCFECGVWLNCMREGCTETIGECRRCHEGY
jgi:hypothetical protein